MDPMATALVTGANRGIGLALCQLLRKRGDDVVAVCRRSTSELDAIGARVIADVDVTTGHGAVTLAKALGSTRLDLAILNAGILREIFFGVHRLGELKRALGISGNILTARLNQLTELGLVERQAYRPNPLIKSQLLRGIFLKT